MISDTRKALLTIEGLGQALVPMLWAYRMSSPVHVSHKLLADSASNAVKLLVVRIPALDHGCTGDIQDLPAVLEGSVVPPEVRLRLQQHTASYFVRAFRNTMSPRQALEQGRALPW